MVRVSKGKAKVSSLAGGAPGARNTGREQEVQRNTGRCIGLELSTGGIFPAWEMRVVQELSES